jgi:type II secretory pathway pseudopilin PulG
MRDERGEITLAQMLIAMTMMLVILAATLTLFTDSVRLNERANDRNDAQDTARNALDAMAAQLRNLASPTPDQPQAVDSASGYDLVFQTVDANGPNSGLNAANVMRVRYCLGGTTSAGKLYRQEQRWTTQATPTAPSTSACPSTDAGWTKTVIVASYITNRRDSLNRPLFTYNASAATDISEVHAQLYVDTDTTTAPPETFLSTGVFLRNQNRRPVAAFNADGTTVPGKIILNGADSSDPEGDPLQYVWFDGSTKIGEGIRYDYTVTRGTSHQIQLKVFDLAGLEGDSTVLTVAVP